MTPPPGDPIRLEWNRLDRDGWNALMARAGKSALEQSWAYGEALAATANRRVKRAVIADDDGPLAIVQAFERRIPVLGTLAQVVRGPVWLRDPVDAGRRDETLRRIAADWRIGRRELLVWMPELPDGAASETAMRSCATRRMTTGYSSAWIALGRPTEALRAGLDGKWRNRLRAAERANLRVEVSHGAGAKLDWLVKRYDSLRRKARFGGPSPALIGAFAAAADDGEVLTLRAFERGRPVAGVLMLRHGASATYCVGWTDDDGRRLCAHNLLLWHALVRLRDDGAAWLDLGGLNPASAPGVARFKLGLGGEVFTLTGTYI